MNQSNKCSRCGKERIVIRTYKQVVGNSTIICVEKACPDKNCQKLVDIEIDNDNKKRANTQREHLKREIERKNKMAKLKKNK